MWFLILLNCLSFFLPTNVVANLRITDCDQNVEGMNLESMIRESLFVEIPNMLGNASSRLEDFLPRVDLAISSERSLRATLGSKGDLHSTYQTFLNMVYYRGHFVNHGRFNDIDEMVRLREYLQIVLNNVKVMRKTIERLESDQNMHLQISCDPFAWLIPAEGQHNSDPEDGEESDSEWFIDTRRNPPIPGNTGDIQLLHGLKGFQLHPPPDQQVETALELFGPNLAPPYQSVLILNRHLQNQWIPRPSLEVDDFYRRPYELFYIGPGKRARGAGPIYRQPEGTYTLDGLMENHLSAQLLRLLSLFPVIMNDPILQTRALKHSIWCDVDDNNKLKAALVDNFETVVTLSKCQPPGLTRSKTTGLYLKWNKEQELEEVRACFDMLNQQERQNPQYSSESSVTFQYLVVALYVNQWDWSQGRDRTINNARGPNYETVKGIFPPDLGGVRKRKQMSTSSPESQAAGEEEEGREGGEDFDAGGEQEYDFGMDPEEGVAGPSGSRFAIRH